MQITWNHIPEHSSLNTNCHETLRSHLGCIFVHILHWCILYLHKFVKYNLKVCVIVMFVTLNMLKLMFTIKQKYTYDLFQYEITCAACGDLIIIATELGISFVWLVYICCTIYENII
jgi:hypothetical protein